MKLINISELNNYHSVITDNFHQNKTRESK